MKLILAGLLVLISAPVFARVTLTIEQAEMVRRDCLNSEAEIDQMVICEEESALNLEQVLSGVYFDKIQACHSPADKKSLIQAERAWIKYRDATCLVHVRNSYKGRIDQGIAVASCMNDQRVERVKALLTY